MRKYLSILFLIILIVPSVACASWWNPLSWQWFDWLVKKDKQTIVVPSLNTTSIEKTQQATLQSKDISTKENIESKNNYSAIKVTETHLISTPIPKTKIENTLKKDIKNNELSIYNIKEESEATSVNLSWNTSIDSESKVLIDSKAYFSNQGVGSIHNVKIENLNAGTLYKGTITALANNSWKSEDFKFQTKREPLKIFNVIKYCPEDLSRFRKPLIYPSSCFIKWETNYYSKGKLNISRENIHSESNDGFKHTVNINLNKGTYDFTIYASDEYETIKVDDYLINPRVFNNYSI
jgi:hypothetical protein